MAPKDDMPGNYEPEPEYLEKDTEPFGWDDKELDEDEELCVQTILTIL